jgi:4-diphosphocytidyl-2-C-methyl-D-erythritol kinase
VTTPFTEKAPAKINLTLRVVGRRPDGYHELESLVVFAGVADTLSLEPAAETTLVMDGPNAAACGPDADNLVLKAERALREAVGRLKGGRFRLGKNLPVAAGIGGGSADAAAALRLLARVNGLPADHPALAAAALATGADVPVCLASEARIMRGVGEILSAPVALPALPAVLVNPGVPLATREVFKAFAGMGGSGLALGPVPDEAEALFAFLDTHGNDLTAPAVACEPAVGAVLDALEQLPGVRRARMSGSGPTCFALFDGAGQAEAAAHKLKAARPDWWVEATRLGNAAQVLS